MTRNGLLEPKTCKRCGTVFGPPKYRMSRKVWKERMFCTRACARKEHVPVENEPPEEKTCLKCDVVFERGKLGIKQWEERKYCSRNCSALAHSGEEHWNKRENDSKDCLVCGETFFYEDSPSRGKNWVNRKYCSNDCAAKSRCGEGHHNWKGGRYMHSAGYWVINEDGKPKLEHRVIWEEVNGPIPEGMIVHHKNGVKTDNHLENLELLSRSDHATHHREDLERAIYERLKEKYENE